MALEKRKASMSLKKRSRDTNYEYGLIPIKDKPILSATIDIKDFEENFISELNIDIDTCQTKTSEDKDCMADTEIIDKKACYQHLSRGINVLSAASKLLKCTALESKEKCSLSCVKDSGSGKSLHDSVKYDLDTSDCENNLRLELLKTLKYINPRSKSDNICDVAEDKTIEESWRKEFSLTKIAAKSE